MLKNSFAVLASHVLGHLRKLYFADERLRTLSSKRGYKICLQNTNEILQRIYHVPFLLQDKRLHLLRNSITHINTSVNSCELSVDGYQVEQNDRSIGNYSGVLFLIRKAILYLRFDLEAQLQESIPLEILAPKSKSYLLCIMYRPLAAAYLL